MDFDKIMHRAIDLRRQYEVRELHLYGSISTGIDIAQGFAGDANNLVKLVDAQQGHRQIANSKEKLEAQLAHCLWSIIVLADIHRVDLSTAFLEAMDRLENHLLETDD